MILLALASLLHDAGVGEHPVIDQARDILDNRKGLERWEDAGPPELDERLKVYEELSRRLSMKPPKRRRARRKPKEPDLRLQMPVLDFAICLFHIAQTLAPGSEEVFEFTESTAAITFLRERDTVRISTNLSGWRCVCRTDDLRRTSRDLLTDVLDELCAWVPQLVENSTIRQARDGLAPK